MKTAVMRLNIDINLYVPEDIILSNRNEKLQKDEIEVPVPEFLQPVADAIYDSIEDHGWISKGDEEDFKNHDCRYDREDFELVYRTLLS